VPSAGPPAAPTGTASLPAVGLRSRLLWMMSGPTRLDDIERTLHALQHQVDQLQRQQDETLAGMRSSIAAVLDDVTARLAALDAERHD
jgi:hypothetical protein